MLGLIGLLLWVVLCVLCSSKIRADVVGKLSATETGFNKRKHTVQGGPHLFVIGAQKCATTSLHHLILSHPSICPSVKKEIHYFDRMDSWSKGAAYYLAHFKTRSAKCVADRQPGFNGSTTDDPNLHFVDATPDYFTNPLVPARIFQSFPPKERSKKRFILILREPVSREFSWYNHRVRLCTKSMREYLKQRSRSRPGPVDVDKLCSDKHCAPLNCKEHAHKASLGKEIRGVSNFTDYYRNGGLVASRSLYMTHLRRWLSYFPRHQFFIVSLSTLLRNTTDTVQRLTHFLGIPEFPLSEAAGGQIILPHENAARVDTMLDCATGAALQAYYQPEVRELMSFLAQSSANSSNSSLGENVTGRGVGGSGYEPPFPPFEPMRCSDV